MRHSWMWLLPTVKPGYAARKTSNFMFKCYLLALSLFMMLVFKTRIALNLNFVLSILLPRLQITLPFVVKEMRVSVLFCLSVELRLSKRECRGWYLFDHNM